MNKKQLQNFYFRKGCYRKEIEIMYCREFDNYYCPRTCDYAKKKEKLERRVKL